MNRKTLTILGIAVFSLVLNVVGITWALPSEQRNRFYPPGAARYEIVTVQDGTHSHYGLEPILSRHPDETAFIAGISQLDPLTLDLVPEGLNYGHMFAYMSAISLGVSRVLGLVDIRSDRLFYVDHPEEMAKIFLVGRVTAAILGLATVVALYFAGQQLVDHTTGILAALSLATSPLFVIEAHYMVNNVSMTFFMLLVVLATLWLYRTNGAMRAYLLSGLLCGFTISNKQSGAVIILLPLMVHFNLFQVKRLSAVVILVLAAITGFLLTSPAYLLDPVSTGDSIGVLLKRISLGSSIGTLMGLVTSLSLPVSIWLLVGATHVVHRFFATRTFSAMFLLVWLLTSVPSMIIGHGSFVRYAIPVLPPVLLGAAWLVTSHNWNTRMGKCILLCFAFALIVGGGVLIVR